MLVFLSERKTGATYNGIVYFQWDLNALIRNFIGSILENYSIRIQDLIIDIS
jgi:hypothetical protein